MSGDSSENRVLNYRILLLLSFLFMGFIAVRLFGMQMFAGGEYKRASEQNGVRLVPISAPRGLIKDRFGETLVKNRPSYSIYLVPYEVSSLDSASVLLGKALKSKPEDIRDRIKQGRQGRFQPIRLKRDLDFATVCYIEEHTLDFPGVIFQVEPTRFYPVDNYGSHIWGYVGELTEKELASDAYKGSSLGDVAGKDGLEKFYENKLRGITGLKYMEVTAAGKILGELTDKQRIKPVQGSTLLLELDWEMQKLAEDELALKGSGAVVALDPRNGAVMVLASVPDFDANLFSGVVSEEAWKAVMSDSLHPLYNRSIRGTYPPGSTMKLFTAAAGLEHNIIGPNDYFEPCYGAKKFGNRSFKCWRPGGHGRLHLVDAIIQSCDVYFYQLGVGEGVDLWSYMMKAFGFGKPTGIDLPAEDPGLVPDAAYLDKRYGVKGWTKYLVVNMAIGQGELLVTPLQMAALFAALGNNGIVYRPRLVSHMISSDGDTTVVAPEVVGHMPIEKENLDILREGLIGVTTNENGTARIAAIKGITVAGKTGTAQNPHGDDHAWFVCFAPAENPQIAVAVIVENAGHGGSVAAPLARKVIEKYLQRQSAQNQSENITQLLDE